MTEDIDRVMVQKGWIIKVLCWNNPYDIFYGWNPYLNIKFICVLYIPYTHNLKVILCSILEILCMSVVGLCMFWLQPFTWGLVEFSTSGRISVCKTLSDFGLGMLKPYYPKVIKLLTKKNPSLSNPEKPTSHFEHFRNLLQLYPHLMAYALMHCRMPLNEYLWKQPLLEDRRHAS